jgi:hypothetical protein
MCLPEASVPIRVGAHIDIFAVAGEPTWDLGSGVN